MSENTLIILVGLPRAGKSTWSRAQGVPIVSTDGIRLGLHGRAWEALAEGFVWAIAKVMVRALFHAGHTKVILDSTSVTRHRRREWKSSQWVREYKVFDTPKDVCIQRAIETDQEYLIPVIENMARDWEEIDGTDLDEPGVS